MESNPHQIDSNPPGLVRRVGGRLFRWSTLRRTLLVGLGFATLVLIFYTVEDIRGKRAWENCKRELEAKGEVLDWSAYIPPPVPDEQNFYKAPKMTEWFVGKLSATNEFSKRLRETIDWLKYDEKRQTNAIAEITIVPAQANVLPETADMIVEYTEPDAHNAIGKRLVDNFGPSLKGSTAIIFVNRSSDQFHPVRIAVKTDVPLSGKDLEKFLVDKAFEMITPGYGSHWQAVTNGVHSLSLVCERPIIFQAADYLAWTEPLEADFDLIRKALERPYARMDVDYQVPFDITMMKFVAIRDVARTLAQRAQCHLLLGQPDDALRELTLVHDCNRMLEEKPTGKPMELVTAMLHVAISGLYDRVIADGIRLHAWNEPQLMALQAQHQDVNLPSLLSAALHSERAAVCRTLESLPLTDMKRWFGKVSELSYFRYAPRGWIYQNMSVYARYEQNYVESFDLVNHRIIPHKVNMATAELEGKLLVNNVHSASPYVRLAAIFMPYWFRTMTTCTENQTLANQAFIACALERYYLAHHQYPETLAELVPQYADKLPNDIVTDQPFKYRRTDDGRFLLYSVGWNETDDGGDDLSIVVHEINNDQTKVQRDWIWP